MIEPQVRGPWARGGGWRKYSLAEVLKVADGLTDVDMAAAGLRGALLDGRGRPKFGLTLESECQFNACWDPYKAGTRRQCLTWRVVTSCAPLRWPAVRTRRLRRRPAATSTAWSRTGPPRPGSPCTVSGKETQTARGFT
jgi:hypothetical protein